VYEDVTVTTDTPDLPHMRRDYRLASLTESSLAADWHLQFAGWLADAVRAQVPEPNAMVLATATPDGRPSTRMVLLKGFDRRGFTFYTNYGSRKATEIAANPRVSLLFPWHAIQRQVAVCGWAERVSQEETEAYFAERPRGSQLGAWVSRQSSVISDRALLEEAWEAADARFGDVVPVPPDWGGFRVAPETVEFWQGRSSRLHDRLRFRLVGAAGDWAVGDRETDLDHGEWIVERLAP
jgi:pyridoxamine 5'-phosphate oxidase